MASILAPVIVLSLWTHLMMLWMYATRIPAIRRTDLVLDRDAPRGSQMATLPSRVRWKSDNYTHLLEHPTVFYASALALAVMGEGDGRNTWIAWTYVALRVAHSLVQATINHIHLRFALFALSTFASLALTIRAALAWF
ncbi:MAG: MAPEG family protein [Myxococcota bacterium]